MAVTNTRGKILKGRGVADRPQPAVSRKGVTQSAHACQLRIGNERLGARVRRGSEHEGLTTRPARRYALCGQANRAQDKIRNTEAVFASRLRSIRHHPYSGERIIAIPLGDKRRECADEQALRARFN